MIPFTRSTETGMTDSRSPQDRLIADIERQKLGLIAYCQMKLDEGDWHGVADAAMDIREKDAKLELLRAGK